MTIRLTPRIAALIAALSVISLLSLAAAEAEPTLSRAVVGPKVSFAKGIDASLLTRAANLKVYKLQPPKLNRESLTGLMGRLFPNGLKGEMVSVGNVVARSDGANFAMLDTKTGLFSMSRGFATAIDDKAGQLPDDAKATDIALAFLKDNGLAPGNAKQMVMARIGHIRSRSFDPATGKEGPIRDQILTVNFSRLIDGTEVIGAASKMIVQVGDGGTVLGAGINWRELGDAKPVGAKALRPIAQLGRDIRSFIAAEMKLASEVTVRQVGLFYYDNGGDYLQPVLGFEATVRTGQQTLRYFGQTALLLTPPERVGPEAVTAKMREVLRVGPKDAKPPTVKGD